MTHETHATRAACLPEFFIQPSSCVSSAGLSLLSSRFSSDFASATFMFTLENTQEAVTGAARLRETPSFFFSGFNGGLHAFTLHYRRLSRYAVIV